MSNVLHKLVPTGFNGACLVLFLFAGIVVSHSFGDLFSNEYYLSRIAPFVVFFVVFEIIAKRNGRSAIHKLALKQRSAIVLRPYAPFKAVFLPVALIATLAMTLLQVRQNYADMLFQTGRYSDAAQFYAAVPLFFPRISLGLSDRGPSQLSLESQVAWQRIAEKLYGAESLEVAESHWNQSLVLSSRGLTSSALEQIEQALPILRHTPTLEGHGHVARTSAVLNDFLASQTTKPEARAHFIEEARNAYQEALAVRSEHWGPRHAKTMESRKLLIDFLRRNGSPSLAQDLELTPVSPWDDIELRWDAGLLLLVGLVSFSVAHNYKSRMDPRGDYVEDKIKALYGSLTNKDGVVMANVEDLCTLLLYTGKVREAERLSRKVYKLAEESPDLVA